MCCPVYASTDSDAWKFSFAISCMWFLPQEKSGGGGKDHNKDISCSFKHYLYIEKLTEGILLISFTDM